MKREVLNHRATCAYLNRLDKSNSTCLCEEIGLQRMRVEGWPVGKQRKTGKLRRLNRG